MSSSGEFQNEFNFEVLIQFFFCLKGVAIIHFYIITKMYGREDEQLTF